MLPTQLVSARGLALVLFSVISLGAVGPPDCVSPPGPPGPPAGQGPGGKDWRFFVHFSEIVGDGFRTLHEGDSVVFEVRDSEKGQQATNVIRA